ncbi:MAG: hypothetical protein M1817_006097 [Caeruleum heppii]|nr:MAG: hypothetical protein M1817_006097 [Caeruleum heppii]
MLRGTTSPSPALTPSKSNATDGPVTLNATVTADATALPSADPTNSANLTVLPPFISQYPASRISSACSCLNVSASTTTIVNEPSPPAGQFVGLRIEGLTTTIFEGSIFSAGHVVTTASGGTHNCDGTNNGANPFPGNTPTSSLDTAATANGFTWDGTYSTSFDDYFVSRIGPDTQTDTMFWGVLVNFQFIPVGGCQFETQPNDEILWAFDAFSGKTFLRLTSDVNAVPAGSTVTVTVTDGMSGAPVAGATVGGQTTDASGQAVIPLPRPGTYRFKAERVDAIRSNQVTIAAVGRG